MRNLGLAILVVIMLGVASAHAEQWSKTYNISGTPDLHVETSDANIHVDIWDQKTIEATIVSSHYKITNRATASTSMCAFLTNST
jgi:hypothetical protein